MTNKRASLGLYDETDDQIDLGELTGQGPVSKPKPTQEMQEALTKAGAKQGFVSREPGSKKTRKRSPYVLQKNIKMRVGMPELLADVTSELGSGSDQETLERAILVLIEKNDFGDLQDRYLELIGR